MSDLRRVLSFRNIGALYIFAAMFIIYSIWVPDTFLQWNTWKSMLSSQAETAIVAIALVPALSAGAFDLSVGASVGVGNVLVAWLLVNHGVAMVPAILLTVLAGVAIGLFNGLLVVKVRIDSFIATLGMSSVLVALIAWLSNSQQILGLSSGFQSIATTQFVGLALPDWLALAVGVVVWYVLERTPIGRRVYATGGNIEAARLAGVRVGAVTLGALVTCAAIAAFAGVLEAADISAGDPTIGPSYLLPAFSAAFLGSTQFRGGRFNVWGTLVAVVVLATGVLGLQLGGAPVWIPNLFNGAALLFAVGLAKYERSAVRAGAVRRLMRFDRRGGGAAIAPGDG